MTPDSIGPHMSKGCLPVPMAPPVTICGVGVTRVVVLNVGIVVVEVRNVGRTVEVLTSQGKVSSSGFSRVSTKSSMTSWAEEVQPEMTSDTHFL